MLSLMFDRVFQLLYKAFLVTNLLYMTTLATKLLQLRMDLIKRENTFS